ncbi:hypothetical protein CPB84DRAFT_1752621 [Gymnopilus junonius]|uniref:CCHC-type domain-containing protein n=1 Tax=Gymnopilus junonius TaxID=109634 RepID=A0A9P5NBD8_GYMJU|nr:hypothetical protein CPB84DRAFT_1752621 [Gymnopilus junonius]
MGIAIRQMGLYIAIPRAANSAFAQQSDLHCSSTGASSGSITLNYMMLSSENFSLINPKPSTNLQSSIMCKCWGCGEIGHLSKDCKKKKFNDHACAVLEHIKGLDEVYEVMTMNAEMIHKFAVEEPRNNSDDGEYLEIIDCLLSQHPFFVDSDK